jgi:hypothetical protein
MPKVVSIKKAILENNSTLCVTFVNVNNTNTVYSGFPNDWEVNQDAGLKLMPNSKTKLNCDQDSKK